MEEGTVKGLRRGFVDGNVNSKDQQLKAAMRVELIVVMLFTAVIPARADMLTVAPTPSQYVAINTWYTVPEPNLNAGQTITGFNLKVGLTSSVVGKNTPGNPSVNGTWQPNPLLVNPPDCSKKANQNGDACILVPSTLDGVNPNEKNKAATAQFTFDQSSASLKTGANTYVAGDPTGKKAPPQGTTQRSDSLNLPWDASGPGGVDFYPTKIAGQNVNALTFGGTLNYQRASWLGPPPIGVTPITRSLPAKTSYINSFWTLDDGSTVPGPNTPLTVAMGQDDFFDPSGNLLAGLVFTYTNDASFGVDLSDLGFETSATDLPLDLLGLAGTPLFNPQVTLNGAPESVQSDYDVPPGYTIQFLFPDTTDSFFIVQGDVSADGVPQLGFAYEDPVAPVPEPTSLCLVLIALGAIAVLRLRTNLVGYPRNTAIGLISTLGRSGIGPGV
jgi:hypothetical protein